MTANRNHRIGRRTAFVLGLVAVFSSVLHAQPLTIYSGRSSALIDPLVERFEEETGIETVVRYGGTSQLALALQQEGERTRADVFWAQDAGALGAVDRAGLFQELPEALLEGLDGAFRNDRGTWVGTSARARVLAYSPERVSEEDLPETIDDLTDERWRGRIGWAPANGSFQAFVTALRVLRGDDEAEAWLAAIDANDAQKYPNNSSQVEAIAAGEIDLGLVNHYYLLRFKERDAEYPVEQTGFEAGDPGNMLLASGVGVLASSDATSEAHRFVEYLLSEESQAYFVQETFELAVRHSPERADTGSWDAEEAVDRAPDLELDALDDLDGTLQMLRRLELL